MKERGVGIPWTADEDKLLKQAVSIYGECDNWKNVALLVPGRTNKACRKRWLHSLSPSIKKTAWTAEEDRSLLSLYNTHGPKWSVIARKIPGRTDDACSKRYREALDPSLKKDEWTADEDHHLIDVYERLGGRWGEVGRELNRSGLACRNRWRMLERKKASASRSMASAQPSSTTNAVPQQLSISTDVSPMSWSEGLIMAPGPYWDNPSTHFSRMIPTDPVQQPAPFLPGHFSPISETTQELHSSPTSPPPFQFTSSSLSSALSIPSNSRSPQRLDVTSPDQPVSPAPLLHITVSPPHNADSHDFASAHTPPPEGEMDDPIHADVDQPSYDDTNYEVMEDTQDDAAGGTDASIDVSISPLPDVSSPPTDTVPLLQLSTSPTVGNAGVGPTTQSPSNSSTSYYRTPAEKAARHLATRKRHDRDGLQPRLSSKLPAASDVHAYACGHKQCWPDDAPSSSRCFLTSQQLSDHWKTEHCNDDIGSNSFRCSLTGCGKGWKSINGLQYHLQISKAHFQRALASIPLPQEDPSPPPEKNDSPKGDPQAKKVYHCPHDQCRNLYKQLSGLRYHLSHGHNHALPAQLDSVPPALAKKFTQKLQKNASLHHTD